jgi:hypothetical protein
MCGNWDSSNSGI